jgi:hypothetical protein
MSKLAEELSKKARTLPPEERVRLAEELLAGSKRRMPMSNKRGTRRSGAESPRSRVAQPGSSPPTRSLPRSAACSSEAGPVS